MVGLLPHRRFLVRRAGSVDDMAETLAQRFMDVRAAIRSRAMDHMRIAAAIEDFTPGKQLARVFRYHRDIQNARGMTPAPSTN